MDNHPEQPEPDNVVAMTDKIMERPSPDELERKRRVALKAFEISAKQLEADAERMEQAAIVGEHPLMKRHQLMDQARALRMATGWLAELVQPQEAPATNP